MPKRKHLISSDSEGTDDENLEEGILSLVAPQKKTKPNVVQAASKAQSSSGSDTSESDDEWTLGSKHKSKKLKQTGSKSRKSGGKSGIALSFSSDEDEEDGRGDSDGSDLGGGEESYNMDSDESDPDSPITFDDGYDENLIGDTEDRIRLSKMTEAEREAEMYDRFTKREAAQIRFQIQQDLKKKAKERVHKSKESKRLRDKDKQKKTDRAKAMEELQAKRLSDKKRKETRQNQPEYNMDDIFRSGGEEEEEDESRDKEQLDWEEEEEEAEPQPPQSISTIEQLSRMKLSRFRLERLVHMPFFEKFVKGAFVRIGIGNHDGRPVYRVAEVIGVHETPKVYALGKGRTNKGLKLKHGRQERVFRMEYVSNSNFSDSEFRKWKSELEKYDMQLPTEDDMKQKIKDFQEAKNFEFTDEHVEHIISEKAKFRRNPVNYAMSKNRLMMEKDHAEQTGDKEKVESLKKTLEELEERAEELDKQRSRGLSAISFINERNRQRNVVLGEAALKEEVATREKKDDPFTRRKCMPTLVALSGASGGQEGEEGQSEMVDGKGPDLGKEETKKPTQPDMLTKEESLKVTEALGTPQLLGSVLPASERKPGRETTDLFSAHDFDIQIELPSSATTNVVVRTNPRSQLKASSDGQQRRSLNLNDYKKRRGLI